MDWDLDRWFHLACMALARYTTISIEQHFLVCASYLDFHHPGYRFDWHIYFSCICLRQESQCVDRILCAYRDVQLRFRVLILAVVQNQLLANLGLARTMLIVVAALYFKKGLNGFQ